MAIPTIVVRVGFATAPMANPQTWTDISADAMEIHTARGRQHELGRIEAGTATIVLKNASGQYWPNNAGGPYYGNLKTGKAVNVRATWAGVTYDLFTGYAESWKPGWRSDGGLGSIVTLTCVDGKKRLAKHTLTAGAGFASELSGTRVGNVLTDYGWPAGLRTIDAGLTTCQATGAIAAGMVNALEHLNLVEDSERGLFYFGPDGKAIFQGRSARFTNALYSTSQAIFGDDLGENGYREVEPSLDDQFNYNNVIIQRLGGTAQEASDATAITDYGKSTLSKTGLLMTTDSEALNQALYLLSQYKDSAMRASRLLVLPQSQAALFPYALTFDLSYRITLRLNQASLDKDYHIEKVSHDWTINPSLWQTNWQLSDAVNSTYWALGVAGLGELGISTKLFY